MPGFSINVLGQECPGDGAFKGVAAYAGPDPNSEYARKNRWIIEVLDPFGTVRNGILIYARKCTRPTPEIDEIKIHHSQDEIIRPGKNRWSPVEFTFYEKVSGDDADSTLNMYNEAAKRIYEWWGNTVLVLTASRHGQLQNYLKNCSLQMLNGVGNKIWEYQLYNCWPMKVSPDELDYTSSAISETTVTMRFDKARES